MALPPTNKLALSFTTGIETVRLLVTGPIPPSPEIFSVFPFLETISKTEDNLPPNSGGIPPL
ncbi:hypothetical protein D3C87_1539310 [compost metagenome]